MALTKLQKSIKRFAVLHAAQKAAEKELDALKAFFKDESGGKDTTFTYGSADVVVTSKSRSGWDSAKLGVELGDKADKFRHQIPYVEVTCRKAKSRVAA